MENKENAYLTCGCAEQCYSNYCCAERYDAACKTGKLESWTMPPMMLIDCFNTDCLMRKDHKLAIENIKRNENNFS